jgi:NAD(P)-dependent dehydrogenase (short-subunit alcohol dehydrogenase family)
VKKIHTIVVGGTRGIGRAIVAALIREGHQVSVISRRLPEHAKERIRGARYFTADVQNGSAAHAAVRDILRRGKPSHLVFSQRFRGDAGDWNGELDTTLTSTRTVIDLLKDHFSGRGENAIVIVSSIAGRFVAGEQSLGYHVAKGGIAQLVQYYAVVLGPRGIRINCVSPAMVLKPESKRFQLKDRQLAEMFRQLTPLGRIGTADDIAAAVVFLCGPGATFITGQDIVVDGGLSLLGHESLIRKVYKGGAPGSASRRGKRD